MTRRPTTRVAVAACALVLLVGCAGGEDGGTASDLDPGMLHVHGLGVDPVDGTVLAATHTGLFRVDGDSPDVSVERVADRWHDLMGFAVDGERLLASGHPDAREDLPVHLGLVASDDGGATWQPVSLTGDADLHALAARDDQVVGWDATTSVLRRSDDGGRTWQELGGVPEVSSVALLADGTPVVVSAGRVQRLEGVDLVPFDPPAPDRAQHVAVPAGGSPVLVTGAGEVARLDPDGWAVTGDLGAPATAVAAVSDTDLLAATEEHVLSSTDGGRTWTAVVALADTRTGTAAGS
ncbi:hypothetical protein [Aquipuribacter nitratireducens]|uniref:WD40/YVTN/BNR-like repeat-containing protein n=1 Tax=Aquipuribacter nitratireducens TaxID=650104 RepID=A0ABW0GPU6_9MICO